MQSESDATIIEQEEKYLLRAQENPWRTNLRRLLRQRSAQVGLVILAIILFERNFRSYLTPYG